MDHLILAGTEVSGTTSAYHYLNAHPEVVGSLRNKTDYSRSPPHHSHVECDAFFPSGSPSYIRLEASPGYLVESKQAPLAIAYLIPDAKVRDLIDLLLSTFQYHKAACLSRLKCHLIHTLTCAYILTG